MKIAFGSGSLPVGGSNRSQAFGDGTWPAVNNKQWVGPQCNHLQRVTFRHQNIYKAVVPTVVRMLERLKFWEDQSEDQSEDEKPYGPGFGWKISVKKEYEKRLYTVTYTFTGGHEKEVTYHERARHNDNIHLDENGEEVAIINLDNVAYHEEEVGELVTVVEETDITVDSDSFEDWEPGDEIVELVGEKPFKLVQETTSWSVTGTVGSYTEDVSRFIDEEDLYEILGEDYE